MVMEQAGLVPEMKDAPQQLSANEDYDELVGTNPGLGPVVANEEPNEMEMIQYNELLSDFLETLYGKSEEPAIRMLKSSRELYQGVAKVAFTVLNATHEKYIQREGPIESSVLFGEGGMISTAVDEVFKLAQGAKIPGSDDMNQYSAAQMDAMRLVGELIEKRQEDGSIDEAQDALIDMEMEAGGGEGAEPLNSEEYSRLQRGAAPQVQPSPDTPEPALPPEQAVDPAMAGAQPQGLV